MKRLKSIFNKIKGLFKGKGLHILTILFMCAFFCFVAFQNRQFIFRIAESCIDLKNSVLFYFSDVFGIGAGAQITVNDYSSVRQELLFNLPQSFDEFKPVASSYWDLWLSWENLKNYLLFLLDFTTTFCLFASVLALPLVLVYFIIKKRLGKSENNDYNVDTKPLKVFKVIMAFPFIWVKKKVQFYISFLRKNPAYFKAFAFFAFVVCNGLTVLIEFLAYYFYFVCTFDIINLYRQVYKLLLDISFVINFVPVAVWVAIAYWFICRTRENIGYDILRHQERCNRGFQNERAVCSEYCGTMGTGKTTAITTMGMSQEVEFRNKALERMIENDMKFPNFPWINLENDLKKQISKGKIFNLSTTRDFIQYKYCKWYKGRKKDSGIWDYDTAHYRMLYDNGLVEIPVWRAIENYAQLYFIYTIESSLILSNYSVRNAGQKIDIGNLPLWTDDFFSKYSVSEEKHYRYCHIIDFDMLRLGSKVLEDNVQKDVFEFGVFLITEVGKERGNNLENREMKKGTAEANQKNDKFENMLKMIRHAATVDNYCFAKVIMDEQRAASLGVNARELCDIVTIYEAEKGKLALPFFEVEYILRNLVFGKFFDLYVDYRHRRGDNSLLMYLFKNIVGFFNDYYIKKTNIFGYDLLTVGVEKAMQEGVTVKEAKIYVSYKKTRAMRFSTDCISGFFKKKAAQSTVGFEEIPEYRFVIASFSELAVQNSYFINEMLKANEVDTASDETVVFFPYIIGEMAKRKKKRKVKK